jgi:hypothetical protein
MSQNISRRSALRKVAGASAVIAATSNLSFRLNAADKTVDAKLKGRINHSVCKWCYPKIELEDLCKAGKEIGLLNFWHGKLRKFVSKGAAECCHRKFLGGQARNQAFLKWHFGK